MTWLAVPLLAITVLPSDRLAMADRLYGKGEYAEARAEYAALKGEASLSADEVLFRLAECDRALGRSQEARVEYGELIDRHPLSRYASRARLMRAMAGTDAEKLAELPVLDRDSVEASIRCAALYHLGLLKNDAGLLDRCIKGDPKGPYAAYAMLHRARLLAKSAVATERRQATELLLNLAYGAESSLADEGLYLAAVQTYDEKKFGDSSKLFLQYMKKYPSGRHAADVRTLAAWSCHLAGRHADAIALCGEGKTDDMAYLRASATYSSGDLPTAAKLFAVYLESFPRGKYVKSAELPMLRIQFDEFKKAGEWRKAVDAARRSLALSNAVGDGMRLAWALEKAGKPEEAAAEYARIASKWPGTDEAAEAMFCSAMINVSAEKWAAAELALAEMLATGKNARRRASAFYWRGIASVQLGHDAEGAKCLKEALKLGLSLDEKREARLVLADVDLRAERLAEAKAAYAELVREGACERMNAAKILAVGKLLDPADAKICARALAASGQAEWRQIGYQLLGASQERLDEFSAAVDSYRKCLAETPKTEVRATAALQLGQLECRSGEYDKAEKTLKLAVTLNEKNVRARAQAYLALARTSEGKGDIRNARAYATLVTALFDDPELCAEAERLLKGFKENPE